MLTKHSPPLTLAFHYYIFSHTWIPWVRYDSGYIDNKYHRRYQKEFHEIMITYSKYLITPHKNSFSPLSSSNRTSCFSHFDFVFVIETYKKTVFPNHKGILSNKMESCCCIVHIWMLTTPLALLNHKINLKLASIVQRNSSWRGFGPELKANPFQGWYVYFFRTTTTDLIN